MHVCLRVIVHIGHATIIQLINCKVGTGSHLGLVRYTGFPCVGHAGRFFHRAPPKKAGAAAAPRGIRAYP